MKIINKREILESFRKHLQANWKVKKLVFEVSDYEYVIYFRLTTFFGFSTDTIGRASVDWEKKKIKVILYDKILQKNIYDLKEFQNILKDYERKSKVTIVLIID